MDHPHSFSIITPVYNEASIIEEAILQNIMVLENAHVQYEIMVVDDGSQDNSGHILRKKFSGNSRIKIIHHATNVGFGGAVKTGIKNAANTYLLCVPADSPLTDELFSAFKNSLTKADVIVSYRIARLGYTPRMRLNSAVYHFLIEIMFDIHLQDFNWIHLYHRRIFEEGKIEITAKGIFMLAEVLIKAQQNGFTFFEIPVVQSERLTGIASASKFSVMLKTFFEMLQFLLKQKKS